MSDNTTAEGRAMAILRWFAEGEVGTSSRTLALASVGLKARGTFGSDAPYDAGDSGRCERLARMCPFVADVLPALIKESARWERWAPRIRNAAEIGKSE